MAGGTGVGRGPTGKIFRMTYLAGHQAPAGNSTSGHLGAHAMHGRVGIAWRGLMMTPDRQAAGHAAAHLEDGDLMALGAGINTAHSRSAVGVDPACRVIVAIVLGEAGGPLAAASKQEERRYQDRADHPEEAGRLVPTPSPVHDDTFV